MKEISRRAFLASAGSGFLSSLAPAGAEVLDRSDTIFGTAFMTHEGGFGAALLAESGEIIRQIALPARGHDVVFAPDRLTRVVVFARRPGTFAAAFSLDHSAAPIFFSAPPGRHFYGHGAFSPDGRLLYATENDFEAGIGAIGIYDATNGFNRIGEFPSYGIGPHELLIKDNRIVVAHGGIETHPDYGRAKLNIATMDPSLVIIDRENGTLLEQHRLSPEFSQLSLRHMDWDDKGGLFVAGQFEGNESQSIPLVARFDDRHGLSLVALPHNETSRLRGYIGSVSVNRHSRVVAVSSPKGNVVLQFPIDDPKRVKATTSRKVCGLASVGKSFVMSAMSGDIGIVGKADASDVHLWDNHLSVHG